MKRTIIFMLIILSFLPFIFAVEFSAKVKEFTLSNGMKFFVYERHQIPTFAGMIMTKVGSADERKGETGLAHFFEHMAFKGTTVIGTKNYAKERPILEEMDKIGNELALEYEKGKSADPKIIEELRAKLNDLQNQDLQYSVKDEIDKIYSENGGEYLNASTDNDTTQYFVMLPSSRLELWFLIESERFKNPVLREFYSERDVIAEERRMWEDNDPDGFMYEEFYNMAFILNPYRHSVVGYMGDIQAFTKEKALNFFKTYYIPNNMMAAVVGDVKFADVKRLAEKYFADIPRGADPPRPAFIEPPQKGIRSVIINYDSEPRLLMGFKIPPHDSNDNVILLMINLILSSGNSSRLVRDLVSNKKLAISISSNVNDPGERYQSLMTIQGLPRFPNTPEDLQKTITEHLEQLKKEPVNKDEIEKAINQAEAHLYRGLTSDVYLAMRILNGTLLFGDVDAEFKRVEALKKVTPEQIMEVAKKTFIDTNETVAILHHKAKEGQQ